MSFAVQEFNRDLSIAVIQQFLSAYGEEFPKRDKPNCLEALSASGLRSVRYAKEIPGLSHITANDISAQAVETIRNNIKINGLEDKITASHNGRASRSFCTHHHKSSLLVFLPSISDASMVMHQHSSYDNRFDVVDLDPYGSPTTFLDGAVKSVEDGGLLCVTCTDMAVLCGNSQETCYVKYGAVSLKAKSCHEMALRIVLQCIQAHANRYGRYIEPLLSLSIDFYVRVFVRVRLGPKVCKQSTSKLGHVYHCNGCESISVLPLGKLVPHDGNNLLYKIPTGPPVGKECEHCGHKFQVGGPFWIDPIHKPEFLRELLTGLEGRENDFGTFARMKGMLTLAGKTFTARSFILRC